MSQLSLPASKRRKIGTSSTTPVGGFIPIGVRISKPKLLVFMVEKMLEAESDADLEEFLACARYPEACVVRVMEQLGSVTQTEAQELVLDAACGKLHFRHSCEALDEIDSLSACFFRRLAEEPVFSNLDPTDSDSNAFLDRIIRRLELSIMETFADMMPGATDGGNGVALVPRAVVFGPQIERLHAQVCESFGVPHESLQFHLSSCGTHMNMFSWDTQEDRRRVYHSLSQELMATEFPLFDASKKACVELILATVRIIMLGQHDRPHYLVKHSNGKVSRWKAADFTKFDVSYQQEGELNRTTISIPALIREWDLQQFIQFERDGPFYVEAEASSVFCRFGRYNGQVTLRPNQGRIAQLQSVLLSLFNGCHYRMMIVFRFCATWLRTPGARTNYVLALFGCPREWIELIFKNLIGSCITGERAFISGPGEARLKASACDGKTFLLQELSGSFVPRILEEYATEDHIAGIPNGLNVIAYSEHSARDSDGVLPGRRVVSLQLPPLSSIQRGGDGTPCPCVGCPSGRLRNHPPLMDIIDFNQQRDAASRDSITTYLTCHPETDPACLHFRDLGSRPCSMLDYEAQFATLDRVTQFSMFVSRIKSRVPADFWISARSLYMEDSAMPMSFVRFCEIMNTRVRVTKPVFDAFSKKLTRFFPNATRKIHAGTRQFLIVGVKLSASEETIANNVDWSGFGLEEKP